MQRFLKTTVVLMLLGFQVMTAQTAKETWIPLFDGKTLNGWKSNESPASFRVEQGQIVCDGPRAHLFYVGKINKANFKNFELSFYFIDGGRSFSSFYKHKYLKD